MQRLIAALGVSAVLVGLLGCGGFGVNISQNNRGLNQTKRISFTPDPASVLVGGTIQITAQADSGGSLGYVTQPSLFVWAVTGTTGATLLEPQCNAPYGGEATTSICVRGGLPAGTATVSASLPGLAGTIALSVQI